MKILYDTCRCCGKTIVYADGNKPDMDHLCLACRKDRLLRDLQELSGLPELMDCDLFGVKRKKALNDIDESLAFINILKKINELEPVRTISAAIA